MRTREQNNVYRICSNFELNAELTAAQDDGDAEAVKAIRAEKARRNRRARNEAMASIGMVRVRGAVSDKIYWE